MFHVPARPLSGLHPFDAHLPGMVACSGYHRFTLPRRDTVMVATCVPRRNTTLVLDNPHARPIGSKTTTGFDTSWAAVSTAIQSRTPARRGSVIAVTMARIASTTTSSARVRPRRMAEIGGGAVG